MTRSGTTAVEAGVYTVPLTLPKIRVSNVRLLLPIPSRKNVSPACARGVLYYCTLSKVPRIRTAHDTSASRNASVPLFGWLPHTRLIGCTARYDTRSPRSMHTLVSVRGPRFVEVFPQSKQKCWGHLKLPSLEYDVRLGSILFRHSCHVMFMRRHIVRE